MCIGSHFGLPEAMLILAVMLQRVELELLPEPESELDLMPSVTLRPRAPVLMHLWPRRGMARAAAG